MGAGCLIIAIAILLIGGTALAFGVPWWGALLILVGAFVVLCILLAAKDSLKTEKGKKTFTIVIAILLVVFLLFVLVKCWGEGTKDDDSWEMCLKCGGDGKYTNEIGFNVTCPRCNGVGYIP